MKNRTNSLIYSVAIAFTLSLSSACHDNKSHPTETANQSPITVSAVKLLADVEKHQAVADK